MNDYKFYPGGQSERRCDGGLFNTLMFAIKGEDRETHLPADSTPLPSLRRRDAPLTARLTPWQLDTV